MSDNPMMVYAEDLVPGDVLDEGTVAKVVAGRVYGRVFIRFVDAQQIDVLAGRRMELRAVGRT